MKRVLKNEKYFNRFLYRYKKGGFNACTTNLTEKESMDMRKHILVTVLAMVATGFLFANGGSEKPAASAKVSTLDPYKQAGGNFVLTTDMIGYENAEIELTWQPNPSQSLTSTMQGRVDDLKGKLEKWAKAHPNVKIVPLGTTSNINDNMAKLQISVVEGNAPDLVAVDSFVMPQFLEYAQDISDVAKEQGFDYNDYFPYIKEQVIQNGQLKALWYTTDVRALFYRKDWIQTPPTTADELIAEGKKQAAQGRTGFIFVGGRGEGSVNNLWGMFWCQGAKLVDKDGNMALEDPKNKQALTNLFAFVKRAVDEGVSPTTVINYPRDSAMFGDAAAGNVAMFLANTSAIGHLREIMGEDEFNAKWGMAPTPVMHAGETSTCSAGGWTNLVFAKDDLHRRLAADLAINLYSSDEAAYSWNKLESALPCTNKQFDSFDYLQTDPYFVTEKGYLQSASTRPAVAVYSTISTECQVALGAVISGSLTPEKAVDQVIANVKNSL